MSKMFRSITRTWNPFTGCGFDCTYCWARRLAEGKLKKSYPDGFVPTTHPDRFNKRFKSGDCVFVCSMGDIAFAPTCVIEEIWDCVLRFSDTKFLLCTKAPNIYSRFKEVPGNLYLGATIETNREIPVSKAPHPRQRALDMMMNQHPHKFISIEPIMDFDFEVFYTWIADIDPEIVEIGSDNYKCGLPEPSWGKVYKLIDILTLRGILVKQKDGLGRLKHAQ